MTTNQSLSAKKSLGQNFLKSKKAIYGMVAAANVTETDVVVEIGPGKGALTRAILETGATLIAYELDQRMIEYLEIEFSDFIQDGKLKLVHKDILDLDIKDELAEYSQYKIIANIPYYITNAIIRKFLESDHQPQDMVLLIQKEVAERIVTRDGKHSILSLSVAVFGTARYVMKVPRRDFSPSPRVDSAVIHVGQISKDNFSEEADEKKFFELVHVGFGQKRKMLLNNFSALNTKDYWREIFATLDIHENIRAEDLDRDLWLALLEAYKK